VLHGTQIKIAFLVKTPKNVKHVQMVITDPQMHNQQLLFALNVQQAVHYAQMQIPVLPAKQPISSMALVVHAFNVVQLVLAVFVLVLTLHAVMQAAVPVVVLLRINVFPAQQTLIYSEVLALPIALQE
jgi:hypothetical protein